MISKCNSHTLLVGIWNGTISLGNSWAVSNNIKCAFTTPLRLYMLLHHIWVEGRKGKSNRTSHTCLCSQLWEKKNTLCKAFSWKLLLVSYYLDLRHVAHPYPSEKLGKSVFYYYSGGENEVWALVIKQWVCGENIFCIQEQRESHSKSVSRTLDRIIMISKGNPSG